MSQMQSGEQVWTTVVGTIRKGMKVIAPDGSCLGTVASIDHDAVKLEGGSGDDFISLTQIDGVSEEGVLLSTRGDATFGLGGQP
ncbi:DUF2171 domain-containing protein [Novosphingobium mangrovi (ex Huang et al. 2023)]|uniref:DUF2171 domain-containing protein n=1 Tax=Novosphingobium mangrovi (ex Huang et al. 2023) TaxID=2976432 RepID=A0ABT2I0V0_9SPHN|nr:DUF2171 domain-containing protein [Novosphingobium mangrovi (ex Huang et al. 2023)]MCT2398425.1 DUF2171 domain-containing protein [Novosphingobium mangrovi (ex Huang et al. 2023)]